MSSRINKIIGITGGIGSGKSVVSRILRLYGYEVSDCDSRAKSLMDNSARIKERIASEISTDAVNEDGTIDRPLLAEIVFKDEQMRIRLNKIVHSSVREDISALRKSMPEEKMLFVEAAIMAESGLAELCDEIWIVDTLDEDLRVARVMERNGCDAGSVRARIDSQQREADMLFHFREKTQIIINDDIEPLLPQINELLEL
ncbi:MAG: dephospho-CoA kinase [Muribaculaceae bacterium]|nr:dephospho-CoA kinase [Muribaculaceae bacterium]